MPKQCQWNEIISDFSKNNLILILVLTVNGTKKASVSKYLLNQSIVFSLAHLNDIQSF